MNALRFLVLAAALFASALAGAQTTYRWVDASGQTVFSDQPPPSGARQVVKLNSEVRGDEQQLSYATRQAAEKFPVALYTATNCSEMCTRARDFLKERAIPHAEKVITSEAEIAELSKILGSPASVPSLIVGRQNVKGFETGAWDNLLDLAGYPKSAPRVAGKGGAAK
jgi:glutaredoxin